MANKELLARLANAGVVSPGDAVRYANYRAGGKKVSRAFTSAQVSNLTYSWTNVAKPIDTDLRNGRRRLVARSRHEAQNNDHVRRFLGLLKTNIVGHQGILLKPRVIDPRGNPDKVASQALVAGWKEWGRKGSPEVTGCLSWRMMQRLYIENVARDGEVLIRKLKGWDGNAFRYALQFLDTELLDVDHNKDLGNGHVIRMGVELNSYRKPVAYHLLSSAQTADSYQHTGRRYQRIPADEIIHEFLPEWVWQTRGIPWATSALLRLMMLGGYEEAELVASRISSAKMGFFEENENALPPPIGTENAEDKDDEGRLITEAEPGTFEKLPRGHSFKPWDPQHPTTAYGDFVKACLRGIASGLGVGYNSLANDLEGVNYSSLRQGAIDERAVWMALQDWMIESFCEPVYRDWLSTSLLADAIKIGKMPLKHDREENYQNVRWQPRRWSWVDPQKEMAGHEKAFAHKVRSPQQVIIEQGLDPEEVLDDWQQWQQMLKDRGIKPEPASMAGSSFGAGENTNEGDDDAN